MANLELSNLTAKQFVATSKTQAKTLDKDATKLQALADQVKAGEVAPEVLGKEIGMTNIKCNSENGKINISFDFNGHNVAVTASSVEDAGEQLGDILGDIVDKGDDTCKSSFWDEVVEVATLVVSIVVSPFMPQGSPTLYDWHYGSGSIKNSPYYT
jgi:hypothetical protein